MLSLLIIPREFFFAFQHNTKLLRVQRVEKWDSEGRQLFLKISKNLLKNLQNRILMKKLSNLKLDLKHVFPVQQKYFHFNDFSVCITAPFYGRRMNLLKSWTRTCSGKFSVFTIRFDSCASRKIDGIFSERLINLFAININVQ